jgi:hypothetical protein
MVNVRELHAGQRDSARGGETSGEADTAKLASTRFDRSGAEVEKLLQRAGPCARPGAASNCGRLPTRATPAETRAVSGEPGVQRRLIDRMVVQRE